MSYDYSSEIYSLQNQIADMSRERTEILKKISVLKQNKSKIESKKKAVSEQLATYDAIKSKATSNFIGTRRDDFDSKVNLLKGAVTSWINSTQNNIDLINQKIATYTAEASNLSIGMSYANQTLNYYVYMQNQNNK